MSTFLQRLAGDVFASRSFRLVWGGSLLAYLATWMATVGAAWLMAQIDARPMMVALIQTASTVPYFLLSLPAGVLADLVDRRRVMLWMQAGNVCTGLVLAALLWHGALHPFMLLLLSFLFGAMLAVNAPAMQASLADTVPPSQLHQAVALNSMSYNMARSLGPAMAGLLLSLVAPTWVFLIVATLYALAWCAMHRLPAAPASASAHSLPPEPLRSALRAGLRFARHSPAVHAVLIRSIAITLCGSALWALLPLLAMRMDSANAAGYGLLVTCLGGGAILGGLCMPLLRARLSLEQMVSGGTLVFAASSALAVALRQPWGVYASLLVGGAAWLVASSVLFTVAQTSVPRWVRARSTALALVTFQGGMAGGAVLWGAVAGPLGVEVALLSAAALSLPLHWINRRYPLQGGDEHDLRPAPGTATSLPATTEASARLEVEIRYRVAAGHRAPFIAQAGALGASRRRNGADHWQLLSSLDDPDSFVERFMVANGQAWRHHLARTTMGDRALYDDLQAFVDPLHSVQTEFYSVVTRS
jgi:MFS family permease